MIMTLNTIKSEASAIFTVQIKDAGRRTLLLRCTNAKNIFCIWLKKDWYVSAKSFSRGDKGQSPCEIRVCQM